MGLIIERKYGNCFYFCKKKYEISDVMEEKLLWLKVVLVDFWIMF